MEYDLNITPHALPLSLIQLLSNSIVLHQTIPYLPVSSLLALGASSTAFQSLVYQTPGVFRHLDLSQVKTAQSSIGSLDSGGETWRNVQLDENVTEDDFYGGPLRGIFSNLRTRDILHGVHTLVLDGLSVPADLITEIITHESFNVRILSARDVQNLNQRKLQQALMYIIRPSRPQNTPKLQGLYIFGSKDAPVRKIKASNNDAFSCGGVMASQGAQIGAQLNTRSGESPAAGMGLESFRWYEKSGKIFPKSLLSEMGWAEVIQACHGLISFDAIICPGPRHSSSGGVQHSPWYTHADFHISPRIATHAIGGCSGCGRAPEGAAKTPYTPSERFPLMSPVPKHSSTVKLAKMSPHAGEGHQLLIRCMECLRSRFCENCHKWWCEDCYQVNHGPNLAAQWASQSARSGENVKVGAIRSCFECGFNCAECIELTQFMCKLCGGGYCLTHNEGSTLTTCDWCQRTNGRRTREMY